VPKQTTPQVEEVYSAADIAARITDLGRQIRKNAGSKPIFLLGILKGASVFLSDLMRAIDGDVGFGFIDVVRDVADTQVAHAMEIDFLNWIDIAGKNVYVLKDVVSTGVIETYLLTQLRQKQPADLELVALLDRPSLRTVELKVNYVVFEAGSGPFAGYGLESDNRFGNLSYIGRVRT
jgi:hypoxanthine phosphoribosyltransferase